MSHNETILDTMRENMVNVISLVPWAQEIGMQVSSVERGKVSGKLVWSEHLVADPDTGIVHGGVITSLLDNLGGMAVVSALDTFRTTATLDLRIDYMRPAEKGLDIAATAECYHVTKTVAFINARAYHPGSDKIIASASGAFALNSPKGWAGTKAAGQTK